MWAVLKFNKKKYKPLAVQLKIKFGNDCIVYCPKILSKRYIKKKIKTKEIYLLDDYLFCFSKNFFKKEFLNEIRYVKGVKYLLEGFMKSQNDINDFISKCRSMENNQGYIDHGAFEMKINKYYKFLSGPFAQKFFKIIETQKNKVKILMGNIETIVDKREHLLSPL
jgi:hypothetical protein